MVATPIGNLQDITLRALELLQTADLIACEDTRVSGKLLSAYGIKSKLLSYNDHNAGERRHQIFDAIRDDQKVVLISDAGTPLVSDPGYKLVRDAIAEGFYVTALPGASSVITGLCLSGLPSDRFFFAGFLPSKTEARKKDIASLAAVPSTLIFFESAKRLVACLEALHEGLGDREAAVMRELTKLHEEAERGTLQKLIAHYSKQGEPKGEIVIVVAPPLAQEVSDEEIRAQMLALLSDHSVKEAAAILSEQTGRPRKELYTLALSLQDKS